jgi:hypothetical protein
LEVGYDFLAVGVCINEGYNEIAKKREFCFMFVERALDALGVNLAHGLDLFCGRIYGDVNETSNFVFWRSFAP